VAAEAIVRVAAVCFFRMLLIRAGAVRRGVGVAAVAAAAVAILAALAAAASAAAAQVATINRILNQYSFALNLCITSTTSVGCAGFLRSHVRMKTVFYYKDLLSGTHLVV
jgi:hypothetical protein